MRSNQALFAVLVICAVMVVGCAEETLQGVEFVCQTDAECNDADPCTQDSCAADGFSCKNLPLEDGDICDDGTLSGICLAGACGESICGDGFVDERLNPAEQCDDGNTLDDDGCAADCTHDAPDLVIDFPERGETFDGDATLTVLGRVDDKGVGIEGLYVNGEVVEVKVDGSFEYEMASAQGLNQIDAHVISLGGKEDAATRGYYYSTQWWDAPLVEAEATTGLGDRIAFRLGQDAFDDFDHPCSTVEGVYVCDEVDDLATVGEIILNDLSVEDFGGSIGLYEEELELLNQTIPMALPPIELEGIGTITLSGDIGLFGGVVMKSEVIELDMNEVGLRFEARDGGLDADVSIDSNVEGPGFSATVRTSATVNIEARFTNVGAVLETDFITLNSLDLVCLFIPPGPPFNTICPDTAGGPLAPLGAL
jgi:cysteine-rich repeat protein